MRSFFYSWAFGLVFFSSFARSADLRVSGSSEYAEFRFLETGGNRLWFVSFLDSLDRETKNLPAGSSVIGRFEHPNYRCYSYYLGLSEDAQRTLEAAVEGKVMGIWDYVTCKEAELSLVEHSPSKYVVHIKRLAGCIFEWDD